MSTGVVIEVNSAAAQRALDAFIFASFGDLMETLGTLVENQTKRRIAVEKRSPDGAAWPTLSASTVSQKGTDNILVDTGRLLGSISHVASAFEAIVGTSVFYAGFLQDGTRKMPARTFMGISAENMAEIGNAVEAWVRARFG